MRRTGLGVFALLVMLAASGCSLSSAPTGEGGDDSTDSTASAESDQRGRRNLVDRTHSGTGGSEATLDHATISTQGEGIGGSGPRLGSEKQGPHPEPWRPSDDDPK